MHYFSSSGGARGGAGVLQPPLVLYNPWNPLQILTMNQKDDDENEEEEKKKREGKEEEEEDKPPLSSNSRFTTGCKNFCSSSLNLATCIVV